MIISGIGKFIRNYKSDIKYLKENGFPITCFNCKEIIPLNTYSWSYECRYSGKILCKTCITDLLILVTFPLLPEQKGKRSWRFPEIDHWCTNCGKEKHDARMRFCSPECSQEYIRKFDLYYIKQVIWYQQQGQCSCGKPLAVSIHDKASELDHKQAICLGGDYYDVQNLQYLCYSCHVKKTRKDIQLFQSKPLEKSLEEFF